MFNVQTFTEFINSVANFLGCKHRIMGTNNCAEKHN